MISFSIVLLESMNWVSVIAYLFSLFDAIVVIVCSIRSKLSTQPAGNAGQVLFIILYPYRNSCSTIIT